MPKRCPHIYNQRTDSQQMTNRQNGLVVKHMQTTRIVFQKLKIMHLVAIMQLKIIHRLHPFHLYFIYYHTNVINWCKTMEKRQNLL